MLTSITVRFYFERFSRTLARSSLLRALGGFIREVLRAKKRGQYKKDVVLSTVTADQDTRCALNYSLARSPLRMSGEETIDEANLIGQEQTKTET